MFRRIMDLFFVYVILEGALRKWIIPDLSLEVQIVRDALPALALVAFIAGNYRASDFGRIGGTRRKFRCEELNDRRLLDDLFRHSDEFSRRFRNLVRCLGLGGYEVGIRPRSGIFRF